MRVRRRGRGFSRPELLALGAVIVMILAVAFPVIAGGRSMDGVSTSLRNLVAIGIAHELYAASSNGRQVTVIDKTISTFGDNPTNAFTNFFNENGAAHPTLVMGWGPFGNGVIVHGFAQPPGVSANHSLVQPIVFTELVGLRGLGAFRIPNARPLHAFLDGRVYDPVFYAPNDAVAYSTVTPAFGEAWEYLPGLDLNTQAVGGVPAWSSYCFSPAAFVSPDVMRRPLDGGWQDPWTLDDGFNVPVISQLRFPALKTQLIEHHWNQNAPGFCNPEFSPGTFGSSPGCEPYYFNHGLASSPATLFYDLSSRQLPNREVAMSNRRLERQTGDGLWSRDTPFGSIGYFGEFGIGDVVTSHHILTTRGVLGRDIFASGPRRLAPASERRR